MCWPSTLGRTMPITRWCAWTRPRAEGARPLDVAPAGEQGRGTRHCRARKRLNDRTHTQKNCLKPHRRQCWVIPPKANSAFVAAMEDVLAVYTRPHNADYPL